MNKVIMLKRTLILLLFTGTTAWGQERLTLQDAIAKALQYNYDIRIANVNLQQADANNTAGNAGMLPELNGTGNLNIASPNTHIEFADGRVQEVNNAKSLSYGGAVNLNWTLFDGGRMFAVKKLLNEQESIAGAQLKEQVTTTVSQVIQAYAQVVLQNQSGIAIDTGLALAKVRMVLSQVKYETGISSKVDFLQARVDYNARQSDSLNQEAALTAAFANLNALMGVDPYLSYDVDDTLTSSTSLQPLDRQMLDDVNLTLSVYRKNVTASELNERIARSYHYPTLAVNGSYAYNYSKAASGFALFNRSYGPSAGLSLNVPIFQGGNINRQVKVASLQTMRDQLAYDKQNTELGKQYRTAWHNYTVAVSAFRLEQENILYAKENLDIQRARFRVGIANTLETREAESSYVDALVRYYSAAYYVKINETRVLELENELVK